MSEAIVCQKKRRKKKLKEAAGAFDNAKS